MLGKTLTRRVSSLKRTLEEKIELGRETLSRVKASDTTKEVDQIYSDQLVKGMRGMKGLFYQTSKLDAYAGVKFRGLSIPEIKEKLPKKHKEPSPEAIFWLLLTGEIPTFLQLEELSGELAARAHIPSYTLSMLNSLPRDLHPMTQLSMGVASLSVENHFHKSYLKGLKKQDYWKPTLEDGLNLVAKIPRIAAIIYRNCYKDMRTIPPNLDCDLSENFGRMLGWSEGSFFEMLRLYLTIHCDHEGGNVSTHTTSMINSALTDIFQAYASGLNGLAGPLHGLANQEVLVWLLELWESLGSSPSNSEIESYVKKTLASRKLVPGYGHAVLRVTDPRFLIQMEFAQDMIKNDPLCNLVAQCYEVIPKVLQEQGKAKNPYPNVDAHSGALLYHYGLKEHEFFTVLFGVSRAIGVSASSVWARGLMMPIERPLSLSLTELEHIAN